METFPRARETDEKLAFPIAIARAANRRLVSSSSALARLGDLVP